MRRLAVAVLLTCCLWSSPTQASQLNMHVDRQAAVCHPIRCSQLRTVAWRTHHQLVVELVQVRHRPTESRNAPARWGRWHTLAATGRTW